MHDFTWLSLKATTRLLLPLNAGKLLTTTVLRWASKSCQSFRHERRTWQLTSVFGMPSKWLSPNSRMVGIWMPIKLTFLRKPWLQTAQTTLCSCRPLELRSSNSVLSIKPCPTLGSNDRDQVFRDRFKIKNRVCISCKLPSTNNCKRKTKCHRFFTQAELEETELLRCLSLSSSKSLEASDIQS